MAFTNYIYNADNFPQTFRAEDRLYVLEGPEIIQGKIHLLQLAGGPVMKRIYRQETGGYLLTDEKNPQQLEATRPPIIGHVVGYERMFRAED